MKLLILTQKIDENDDVLGFFHRWVLEFAKHCEKVTVICLKKGEYNVPKNVEVLSLGKEDGVSKIKYIINFYKYIFSKKNEYDSVFVHMNPEYVILGGLFWKLLNKKIGLWYVHRQVNLKLKIAEKIVDIVFTAAKESFRLESKKINIMGHGIDTDKFKNHKKKSKSNKKFEILHVGRITKIKNIDILVKAAKILKQKLDRDFKIKFIGSSATTNDKIYLERIQEIAEELGVLDNIEFFGAIPNKNIENYYFDADITVNMVPTGGLDKSVLESMASGTPVLTSNQAFAEYFGKYKEKLIFKERDEEDLAQKIIDSLKYEKKNDINKYLQEVAQRYFNVDVLIKNILKKY